MAKPPLPPECPRCRCGMAFAASWPCYFHSEEWQGQLLLRSVHSGTERCFVCGTPEGQAHHIGCPYDRCPGHGGYRLNCHCRPLIVQSPDGFWTLG